MWHLVKIESYLVLRFFMSDLDDEMDDDFEDYDDADNDNG